MGGAAVDLLRLAPSAWRAVRGRQIRLCAAGCAGIAGSPAHHRPRNRRTDPGAPPVAEIRRRCRGQCPSCPLRRSRSGCSGGANSHELSGGLRQRALIASALAGRPRLLIADEPTTALDVTVQQQVLSVFQELARAGHGVLLITHDLAVAAQVADRIAVMQDGRLSKPGQRGWC